MMLRGLRLFSSNRLRKSRRSSELVDEFTHQFQFSIELHKIAVLKKTFQPALVFYRVPSEVPNAMVRMKRGNAGFL